MKKKLNILLAIFLSHSLYANAENIPEDSSELPENTVIVFLDKETINHQQSIMVKQIDDGLYQYYHCYQELSDGFSIAPESEANTKVTCSEIDKPITEVEIREITKVLYEEYQEYQLQIEQYNEKTFNATTWGAIVPPAATVGICLLFKKCKKEFIDYPVKVFKNIASIHRSIYPTSYAKTRFGALIKVTTEQYGPAMIVPGAFSLAGAAIGNDIDKSIKEQIKLSFNIANGSSDIVNTEAIGYLRSLISQINKVNRSDKENSAVVFKEVQSISEMNTFLSEIFLVRDTILRDKM